MAMSRCARAFSSFNCRSDPDLFRSGTPSSGRKFSSNSFSPHPLPAHAISSLIFKFPANFVRKLSTKDHRNYSNIGVAQVATASWTNQSMPAAKAVDAAAAIAPADVEELADVVENNTCFNGKNVEFEGLPHFNMLPF